MFIARYSALIASLTVCTSLAFGETVGSAWAPGVSESGGWLDANKAHVPYSWEDAVAVGGAGGANSRTDANLCWAAQSSNMLQYWQNAYLAAGNKISAGTPNGYTPGRESATRRQYQIFEHFVGNWTDLGGSAEYGIPWYLTGEFFSAYPTDWRWSECFGGPESGGFFKNIYPSAGTLSGGDFRLFSFTHQNTAQTFADIRGFSNLLINSFENLEAVVGLNVYLKDADGDEYKHALTAWGCDFDAVGLVTKIYLTDSDDGEIRLGEFAVETGSDGLYLTDEGGYSARIQDFSMLSVGKFYPIPEPSVFGLFAGTLVLSLAIFRRRKR